MPGVTRKAALLNQALLRIGVVACGANVLLNFLLIPPFGIEGAATATTLSCILAVLLGTCMFLRFTGLGVRDMLLLRFSDISAYWKLLSRLWRARG